MIEQSKDEAFLFLKKWRDNSPLLRIISHSSAGMLNAIGTLSGLEDNGFEVSGNAWDLTVLIEGAAFSFGTPEEAPASVRATSLEKYESLIEVRFASGERLALMELKEPPQSN
jgi:hypothetical protein